MVGEGAYLGVALGHYRYYLAFAGFYFLHVGDYFFVGALVGGEKYHGHILVDEGNGAVLHLGGGIAFGMDVGYFFELQRAFEGYREIVTPAEVQEIGGVFVYAGYLFYLGVEQEGLFYFFRDVLQLIEYLAQL